MASIELDDDLQNYFDTGSMLSSSADDATIRRNLDSFVIPTLNNNSNNIQQPPKKHRRTHTRSTSDSAIPYMSTVYMSTDFTKPRVDVSDQEMQELGNLLDNDDWPKNALGNSYLNNAATSPPPSDSTQLPSPVPLSRRMSSQSSQSSISSGESHSVSVRLEATSTTTLTNHALRSAPAQKAQSGMPSFCPVQVQFCPLSLSQSATREICT